jgi:hypothetical protein
VRVAGKFVFSSSITALCAATISAGGKINYLHTTHRTLNDMFCVYLVFEKISKENVFRHQLGLVLVAT